MIRLTPTPEGGVRDAVTLANPTVKNRRGPGPTAVKSRGRDAMDRARVGEENTDRRTVRVTAAGAGSRILDPEAVAAEAVVAVGVAASLSVRRRASASGR